MNLPSIGDRKIRFASIGCRRISKTHIAALAVHSNRAERLEVNDANPDSRDAGQAAGATAHSARLGFAVNPGIARLDDRF